MIEVALFNDFDSDFPTSHIRNEKGEEWTRLWDNGRVAMKVITEIVDGVTHIRKYSYSRYGWSLYYQHTICGYVYEEIRSNDGWPTLHHCFGRPIEINVVEGTPDLF